MPRKDARPYAHGDSIDRNWSVPRELFTPIFHIAASHGFAWEQVATAMLYNGATDMALSMGDEGALAQLKDAMDSLVETSLRSFYILQESWQQLDTAVVHQPGDERLSGLN